MPFAEFNRLSVASPAERLPVAVICSTRCLSFDKSHGVWIDKRCLYLMLIVTAINFCQSSWRVGGLHHQQVRRVIMSGNAISHSVRIGFVAAVFSVGFLCGSMTQHSANAQLGELGGEMLKKAEGSGGALGSVAQLGTAITDMEKHVSGLQQNLDTLKKVQAALGMK
jgi:hypothetical protein